MKHLILLPAVIVCVAAVSASPESKVDFWSYASGGADAVLYVNTKQAEKAVDEKLYGQIKKDKHKAIDEMDEKSILADKVRDLEGVANIYITNADGSTGVKIEGVARVYGGKKSIKSDIEKLSADAKENGFGVSSKKAGKTPTAIIVKTSQKALSKGRLVSGSLTPKKVKKSANQIFNFPSPKSTPKHKVMLKTIYFLSNFLKPIPLNGLLPVK